MPPARTRRVSTPFSRERLPWRLDSSEGTLGLVQEPFDPEVDLAELNARFVGQVRDGFLANQAPPDDSGLFLGGVKVRRVLCWVMEGSSRKG
jgi:hypothetical protein